jgi:hypothetical protein
MAHPGRKRPKHAESARISKTSYTIALILVMAAAYAQFASENAMEDYVQVNVSTVEYSGEGATVVVRSGCTASFLPVPASEGYALDYAMGIPRQGPGSGGILDALGFAPSSLIIRKRGQDLSGEMVLKSIRWMSIGISPVDGMVIALSRGIPVYVDKSMTVRVC